MKTFRPFTMKNVTDNLTPGINAFFKKVGIDEDKLNHDQGTADFKARQALGLQLLNFVLNGSSNDSTVPPIRFGVLRGSGSVFVDGILIGDSKANYPNGTPNHEYTASSGGDVTIGFNTAYAARLHETTWVPGGRVPSKQTQNNPAITGDVGNKYIERHIKADGQVLLGLYADIFKKHMGM